MIFFLFLIYLTAACYLLYEIHLFYSKWVNMWDFFWLTHKHRANKVHFDENEPSLLGLILPITCLLTENLSIDNFKNSIF